MLLRLRLWGSSSRTKVLDRARGKQPGEYERANGTRRLRVDCGDLLNACRPKPAECNVVRVRPERLRVREEGVEPGYEGRTPEVGRGPPVWKELGRGRQRQRVWLEEREEVGEEETSVRGELANDS